MEKGHYGHYSGNARHSRVTSHNMAATKRDDEAHMQYLKEDIKYDNKHGHSDIDMTADEKHISKLAGDLKYDEKQHGAAHQKRGYHNHTGGPDVVSVIKETQPFIDKNRKDGNLPPTSLSERMLNFGNAEGSPNLPIREVPELNAEEPSFGSQILGGIRNVSKFIMNAKPTRRLGNNLLTKISENN